MVQNIFKDTGDYLVYKINTPFIKVKEILKIDVNFEQLQVNFRDFFLFYFRWSKDGVDFSEWVEIKDSDLQIFKNLNIYSYNTFYLDFKIQLTDNLTDFVLLKDINLILEYKNNPKKFIPFQIKYANERGSTFLPINQFAANFNPYLQSEAINFYKQLSFQTNNLFGIECMYIKADSVIESKDPFLLEWGLLNHRPPLKLKFIVPDNAFGDNKINFNGFGMEWEIPFEVLIDKRYFESIFGITETPQQRDVIYIPMQKRLYQIESSQLEKTFMLADTHYKLALNKYSKPSNVFADMETTTMLENMTMGIEKMFELDMKEEEKKVTNPQQLTIYNQFTDYRKFSFGDPSMLIDNNEIKNKNIIISNTQYNFNNIIEKGYSTNEPILTYNITNDSSYVNQSITFLNNFNSNQFEKLNRKIKNIFINDATISIYFNVLPTNIKIGDLIGINDNLIYKYFGKILSINKANQYIEIEKDELILQDALNENVNLFKDENSTLKACKCNSRHIISNLSNGIGYDISIIENTFLNLVINNKRFIFKLNYNINKWNGFIVQILGDFNQISVFQYDCSELKFNSLKTYILDEIIQPFQNNKNYFINLSPSIFTNLRIFKRPIKEEEHINMLQQNLILDAQNAILIDNANNINISPFIGQMK